MKRACFPSILIQGLLVPAILQAELPPRVYSEKKAKAPLYLEVKVSRVEKDFCFFCARRDITVRAIVEQVHRQPEGSNLKQGTTLTIRYSTFTRRPEGWVGPGDLPVLSAGKTYPAFLRQISVNKVDGVVCEPAARGRSFSRPR